MAPNLLQRCFEAETPNTVWASDITYIATKQGWLYLAVVLDLFLTPGGGLVDAKDDVAIPDAGRPAHGVDATYAAAGVGSPFGSRGAVCLSSVSAIAKGARWGLQHESKGRLLGQRGGGEFLSHAEVGVRTGRAVRFAEPSEARTV
ncbi:MAG: hypothetical protein P9L94_17340 [Candidatus Hinthialibacter antarcticus]|nr:hypothetical protein [Candidatus Hinthialibacter antarcticus]